MPRNSLKWFFKKNLLPEVFGQKGAQSKIITNWRISFSDFFTWSYNSLKAQNSMKLSWQNSFWRVIGGPNMNLKLGSNSKLKHMFLIFCMKLMRQKGLKLFIFLFWGGKVNLVLCFLCRNHLDQFDFLKKNKSV